jgi:CO/xanthine dehydrogenase Mo-binding subunit
MINFQYTRVSTPKAAVDALVKDSSALFIAGGTNLVDLMKKGVMAPERLINITHPCSTVAKGFIKSIDTKSAERAPGVIAVITHVNAPKVPGYQTGKDPSKPRTGG